MGQRQMWWHAIGAQKTASGNGSEQGGGTWMGGEDMKVEKLEEWSNQAKGMEFLHIFKGDI